MHESKNDNLEKMCKSACLAAENRPAEQQDAESPVAAVGTHDGQRLANPVQSATSKRKCKDRTEANMERVCTSRSRNTPFQKESCQQERMVSLGNAPTERRLSVHSEGQTELVTPEKPNGKVCTDNVLRLLEYQQYRCALSGRELTPQTAALDHIVPIRFDGQHIIENTQVLHKDVNRAKGSLTNEEYIQMCHEVVLQYKTSITEKESE